jgi:kynurenine formamidase
MAAATTLTRLVEDLSAGRLTVVDLTQPLGPETPVIGLPPIFGASPGVTIDVISKYDEKGPAWYWNTLRLGEHTGTHFDAPVHWITGRDLPDSACDTIPAKRFVGPACVIDIERDAEENPDFLVTPERIAQWESQNDRIPAGSWVLLRTGWSRRQGAEAFLNVCADGTHSPGFDAIASRLLAQDSAVLRIGAETVGHRRRPGRDVRSPISESHDHARRGQVRPGQPVQSRSAAADGRRRDRGAVEDRERQRQPAAGARDRAGVMRRRLDP